jgi:hypothetical protein
MKKKRKRANQCTCEFNKVFGMMVIDPDILFLECMCIGNLLAFRVQQAAYPQYKYHPSSSIIQNNLAGADQEIKINKLLKILRGAVDFFYHKNVLD